MARKFLREGLYGSNFGWPYSFCHFFNLPDTFMEKIHRVSNMVCWWEHETFLLLLLDFLLCQVLCFLCCSTQRHYTHLSVALVAAVVTCWSFPQCCAPQVWSRKLFWTPRGCDPACSMGNLAQSMNSNHGNLLFSDSSLWVYQHKLMLIFQHQRRDWDII